MSNSGKFSGILAKDSPQLLGLVKRYISENLNELSDGYSDAWRNGRCDERSIIREEGVSYNPLPARIATLLISDGGVRDSKTIYEALITVQLNEDTSPIISLVNDIDTLRHLHMTHLSTNECKDIIDDIESRSDTYSPELNPRLYQIFISSLERCKKKYQ